MMEHADREESLLRSVALQNAQSILLARQRAEHSLLEAKAGLEKKTTELALALSMTRATLEASRDGILATNDDGIVIGFNQQYARMWGLPATAMQIAQHSQLLAQVSQKVKAPEKFLSVVQGIYDDAPASSFDILELLDGRIFERTSTIQLLDGANVGRVWVFRDITEQRKAEDTLREETRILELLNKSGTALTAQLDVQTLVQAVTDAATDISGARMGAFFYKTTSPSGDALMLYTLSGATPQDFGNVGQPRPTELFGPTFAGLPAVRIDDVTADPRYGHSGPHFGMPAGHRAVRSYLAVPVKSGAGEVMGGLFFGHPDPGVFNERAERLVLGIAAQAGVALDNARLYEAANRSAEERKVLLENERAARTEAEHLSRMKDEFLAMLAHELRNPLAPLRNSVEILRRGAGDLVCLEETRCKMARQVAHMTRLVDDLLDVSRISRGNLEMRSQPVCLADAIASAVETCQPALDARHHSLRLTLPDDLPALDGDMVRLSQAFSNLLNNAARFTPDGGALEVRVLVDGTDVVVDVEDNGIGLPEHLGPRIFDMFVQGSTSPTTALAQGGLGIGLTLVRRIVEMHGGSVRAEGRGGGPGSRFTVRLPLPDSAYAAVAAPMSPAVAAPQPGAFKPRRILVVDDNIDAAATLAQLLEMMGHEVSVAHDGIEGVELAQSVQPDLIFLDIGMPRMDGYEACRQIRKLGGEVAAVTVVALTGWGQAEDKRKAMEAGFDQHLTKPVDPDKLEELAGSND